MQRRDGSIIRPWVAECLSYRMQAVLLSALRGCDGLPKEDASKKITRSLRFTMLFPDEPEDGEKMRTGKAFCHYSITPENVNAFFAGADQYPLHFWLHLMHAAEIVGYFCPIEPWRSDWSMIYHRMVDSMHVLPEPIATIEYRLRDRLVDKPAERKIVGGGRKT